MQAWLDKRRIAVASLLVAGLSAPAGATMSLPTSTLGSARVEQAAELVEVTVDQAAIRRHRALGHLRFSAFKQVASSSRVAIDRKALARHRALGRLKLDD